MKKPSKKILLLIGTACLAVGAVGLIIFLQNRESYSAPSFQVLAKNPLLVKDSDSDGLKDWEEQLWKTDPYNPDTDGDGVPDGLEIKHGTNPLDPRPNDLLDTGTITSKVNTETAGDLTETDKFSRDLFMKIMASGQAGTAPTQADFQTFINTVISQEQTAEKPKQYGADDFMVDRGETAESIRNYGNGIARIMAAKPPRPVEIELNIVERATSNGSPAELNALDNNIAQYEKIKAGLQKITVPESALSFHIAFMNSIESLRWSAASMKLIMSDPVKALPGVGQYSANAKASFAALHDLKNYFADKGVVWNAGEPGYALFMQAVQ